MLKQPTPVLREPSKSSAQPYTITDVESGRVLSDREVGVSAGPVVGGGFATQLTTGLFTGEKFPGGLNPVTIGGFDYWTLRRRSAELFDTSHHARGFIKRMITNEISTGLTPEAAPKSEILGIDQEFLNNWARQTETRFAVWACAPSVCDWMRVSTFGEIQAAAKMEALISGDCVVVFRPSTVPGLQSVQLIRGNLIQGPGLLNANVRQGNTVKHGVELDRQKRVVAYWILQTDGKHKRQPVMGEKSGRRIAWMIFGTERRLDEVRGHPILSLMIQSLQSIGDYRDSAQRKALINSFITMWVEKTEDSLGSLPINRMSATNNETLTTTTSAGNVKVSNLNSFLPGTMVDGMAPGEKLQVHSTQGTDVNFGDFEEAIIQSLAWANEIPPEIMFLSFSSNYSASQAAINEYNLYLHKVRINWGSTFCTPIYNQWLVGQTLIGRIVTPGLVAAWRRPDQYDIFGAWTSVDWYGSIKPSTDMKKQTQGAEILIKNGWSTNAAISRQLTGTNYESNMKRLLEENKLKVLIATPLLELEQKFGTQETNAALSKIDIGALAESVSEIIQENTEA